MDLVEFLTARLDEDEQAARAATDGPWAAWQRSTLRGLGDLLHAVTTPGQAPGARASIATASWLDAEHIARHDPARVLAEVDAKRRILASYTEAVLVRDEATQWAMSPSPVITNPGADGVERWTRARDAAFFLEPAIRLLAQPYASHPDYDEAWRP
ncbi:DUF6221 family protein [Streptomyces sp. NPDC051079]|uniref:DUF6221 family protein n=1 Tax=Streptomyces sp. NPDC051079 TaxID=3155043 RepID=UPI00344B6A38